MCKNSLIYCIKYNRCWTNFGNKVALLTALPIVGCAAITAVISEATLMNGFNKYPKDINKKQRFVAK